MNEFLAQNEVQKSSADTISAILSNPELLSKASEIIAKHTSGKSGDIPPQNDNFSDVSSNLSHTNEEISQNSSPSSPTLESADSESNRTSSSDFLSILSSFASSNISHNINNHTALLLAIRPYLSERRQEMIDSLVRLSKITAIFNNLS